MAERHPGLDGVRAITMLLVVAGHAVVSFMVTPVGWAIQDRSRFLGADLAAWIIRAFAMPTFFWLAGYASRAVLERKGLRGFVSQRLTRVLLPLAIALVPCSIAVSALWDWGREVGLRGAVPDLAPKLQASELPILLGHLWFLYYLTWLSGAAIAVTSLVRSLPRWLPTLAVPLVPSLAVLAYIGALHTDTPLGFIPDAPMLIYMGGFFAWGWIVHARPNELERYARRAWWAGLLALGALAIVIVTLARAREAAAPSPPYAIVASAVFTVAVMVFGLGAGVRYLLRRHTVLELTADASFTLYILHLPTAVLLQILLADVPIFGPLKFVAIVAATLTVGVGLHVAVVRRWRRPQSVRAARAPA